MQGNTAMSSQCATVPQTINCCLSLFSPEESALILLGLDCMKSVARWLSYKNLHLLLTDSSQATSCMVDRKLPKADLRVVVEISG